MKNKHIVDENDLAVKAAEDTGDEGICRPIGSVPTGRQGYDRIAVGAWLRKVGGRGWISHSCSGEGKTAVRSHCLAPQTWSIFGFARMDLRTLRLAIANREKGASWRDQGWAGENGDRSASALQPSQIAGKALSALCESETGEVGRSVISSPSPAWEGARTRRYPF